MDRYLKRMKNNKGISILEFLLVAVITIMILGMLLISYNLINRSDVKKSARRLENAIKTARVTAMSKGRDAGTLTFVVEGGNVYASIPGAGSRDLISGGGVSMLAVKSKDYSVMPAALITGGALVFETSGKVRMEGIGCSSHNIYSLSKGNKTYLVTVYEETGAVEVKEL